MWTCPILRGVVGVVSDPRRAPVSDGMVREGRLKLQSLERSGSSTLQLVRIAKEDRELKEVGEGAPSVLIVRDLSMWL